MTIFYCAVKYGGGASGAVDVTLRCETGGGIEIEVADRGVGIPKGELERIFDPFVQSSTTVSGAGGTGLGLAICREIIENGYKGKIVASSRPEGGAVFTVRLPGASATERVI